MKKIIQFLKSLLTLLKSHFFPPLRNYWQAVTANWYMYLESPVPLEELTHSREAASLPSFSFFFLAISASIIATFGLLLNSSAVIIGAMIVAPLMNPILSISFAIVTGNWKLYRVSLITVFLGTSCSILVSSVISALVPVSVVGSEIVARTEPTLIDLVIAIAAGAAGSFSLTRRSIASSIAGVAIAVALVPPLCVTGIGLGIGAEIGAKFGQVVLSNLSTSGGAFLLFLANLSGITFAACIVFLCQSYGNLNKAFQSILVWFLIIALLYGPLNNSLKQVVLSNRIDSEIYQIRKDFPAISQQTQIRYVNVRLERNIAYITVLINAPEGLLTNEYLQSVEKRIFDSISKMGVTGMNLVIRVIPVRIKEYKRTILIPSS